MGSRSIARETVLITGASSGIGKACAEQFAALGAHLILAARRFERIQKSAQELAAQYGIRATPVELDVQKHAQVENLFKDLQDQGIEIDILVNNAGLALSADTLQEGDIQKWETMIDTNVKGLLYMTKAFLPSMIARNRGHVINIGSIAGHGCYRGGNVYCATKHAVRAISQSLRLDVMGTAIRVSEVDPGAVHTEFSEVRFQDKEKRDQVYEDFTPLAAGDIADAVAYCATRSLHVNVSELVVFPQAQASLRDISRQGNIES